MNTKEQWRATVMTNGSKVIATKRFDSREEAIEWARQALDFATLLGKEVWISVAPVSAETESDE